MGRKAYQRHSIGDVECRALNLNGGNGATCVCPFKWLQFNHTANASCFYNIERELAKKIAKKIVKEKWKAASNPFTSDRLVNGLDLLVHAWQLLPGLSASSRKIAWKFPEFQKAMNRWYEDERMRGCEDARMGGIIGGNRRPVDIGQWTVEKTSYSIGKRN